MLREHSFSPSDAEYEPGCPAQQQAAGYRSPDYLPPLGCATMVG